METKKLIIYLGMHFFLQKDRMYCRSIGSTCYFCTTTPVNVAVPSFVVSGGGPPARPPAR